ncbi:hypothetical protein BH10PSE14_BH10PSE14_03530 [soil metagenome]
MADTSLQLVVGMPREEVDIRLKIYDRGGAFSRNLIELWQHAGPIIIESMRDFIATVPQRMNQDPIQQPEQNDRMIADALEHARRKFSSALSPQWIDAICQRARMISEHGVSVAMIVAGTNEISRRVTKRIAVTLDLPDEDISRLCDTVREASSYEIEILLWQIGELRRQEAALDRTSRAENFQQLVSRSVEHALANAQLLSEETDQTIKGSQVMLGDVAEVANAAQQSANAMRDAAQIAAGLSETIDTVASRMVIVLAIEQRASVDADAARTAADDLSREIGAIASVLDMIRNIAGQTNLLALNATIEAARAGDAGRGFAIVAQEVKSLAGQTAHATDQIAARIAAIQNANKNSAAKNEDGRITMVEAREAIHEMMDMMKSQVERVTSIAAAIDETATAAHSVSDLASHVNERTHKVTDNLARLSEIFTQVATDLERLKTSTDDFIETIGA